MRKKNSLIIGSLVLVLLLGLMHLPLPFGGDQAFFTLFARMIDEGYIPYRDIWDVKQPGIYYFFYLAGKIFGYSEWGVHLIELLYWMGLTVYGVWVLQKLEVFRYKSIAWWFPLFTAGLYYAIANPHKLTQVEGLVGFPLFVSMTLPFYALSRKRGAFFLQLLSGLALGIVLFFKLAFLPILGLYAMYLTVEALTAHQRSWRDVILSIWLPIVFGSLIVPAWFFSYCIVNDMGPLVWQTYFEIPFTIIQEVSQKDISIFLQSTFKALVIFGPLGLMSLFGFLYLNRRNRALMVSMAIWCLSGLWVIYLQKFSYWDYQYLLLLVPLGTMALVGLDFLMERYDRKKWRNTFYALIVLQLMAYGWLVSRKALPLFQHQLAIGAENNFGFKRQQNPAYGSIKEEVTFLASPGTQPGPIYVGGNPLYYHLSGRLQGAAIIGWSFELLTEQLWITLAEQLDEGKVPYIFLEKGYTETSFLQQHAPFNNLLNTKYRLERVSEQGAWYALKKVE